MENSDVPCTTKKGATLLDELQCNTLVLGGPRAWEEWPWTTQHANGQINIFLGAGVQEELGDKSCSL